MVQRLGLAVYVRAVLRVGVQVSGIVKGFSVSGGF